MEVFVDDFIGVAIPDSKEHLDHCANAIQTGVHNVFPEDENDKEDPLFLKKAKKGDSQWAAKKDALGFEFDGGLGKHTLILAEEKRNELLAELK